MTELALYGNRMNIPYDALSQMVPIPTTEDCEIRWRGWMQLYAWTVRPVLPSELLELVSRGVVVS